MYNIHDLHAMTDEQLKGVAESMGMKKIDLNDKDNLVYSILDQQAENAAASGAVKRTERPARDAKNKKKNPEKAQEPKKKGRPRKNDAPKEQPAGEVAAAVEQTAAVTTEGEAPAPKKRGRKPKAQKAGDAAAEMATETAVAQSADTEKPEEQAPVAKSTEEQESAARPEEGKRRGRKRRNAADNETAAAGTAEAENSQSVEAPAAEVVPEAGEPTPESGAADAVNQEQKPAAEQPVRQPEMRQRDSASLGSFFPRAEGRRFVPRSQREKEEAAAAAAAAPITIGEPWQQPQQNQQQGQGRNRNKKNRNGQNMQGQQQRQPESQYDFEGLLTAQGVLEINNDGHGFLRSADFNYLPSPDDVYVTPAQIKANSLRMGDVVEATIRPPRANEKYFLLSSVTRVNGREPRFLRDRVPFEHLTPLFPDEKFDLTGGRSSNISTRVVDMFSPIGKGQRGLIVAPPKTGKTILLKDIANAIAENHPETYIMILLIDERPEEVTDMQRSVNAEVIASTFDEPADRHVKIAGIVLEKAKRLVECGHDVVILLDSITRLARAYNTCAPASGKILSGGVDANALQKPKRFFGAARNIENGGSLTIIATALTETSSKMDEVIFEEFKGTGNMELQLDRKLSNKRVFPAVDIMASSTRRDDLLLRPETLNRMWILRRFLSDRTSIEAMEFIKDRMERTSDNDELLRTMGD